MPKIAILNIPDATTSATYGLRDMFNHAASLSKTPLSTNLIDCSNWQVPASPLAEFDAVILPPSIGSRAYRTPSTAFIHWLAGPPKPGGVVSSVCTGAYILAAAGLLDGKSATTHWALEADFSARFPAVDLQIDQILIRQPGIITVGGIMSWVDLGLELIARLLGDDIMRQTGRFFILDTGQRAQSPYREFRPNLTHGDAPIQKVQHYLAAHYPQHSDIQQLATIAILSPRTFQRRFQAATSLTPSQYKQNLRVEAAQRHLERKSLNIEQIALAVGYENTNAFRKVFHRQIGLSPSEYRQRLAR